MALEVFGSGGNTWSSSAVSLVLSVAATPSLSYYILNKASPLLHWHLAALVCFIGVCRINSRPKSPSEQTFNILDVDVHGTPLFDIWKVPSRPSW